MSAKVNNIQAQEGLTLVELLIVVVIIALVASLALFQRGNSNEHFKRQNVASELKVAFERARFDSVKRRALAPVSVGDPDLRAYVLIETSSLTLRVDRDQNGTLDAADDQVYQFPSRVVASGYGFTIPEGGVTVAFNQRGEAALLDGINQPQFMVCNGAVCPPQPGNNDTNTVLVTSTGTVNLLPGGVAIPTFTAPNPANPTVDIRQEVVLP